MATRNKPGNAEAPEAPLIGVASEGAAHPNKRQRAASMYQRKRAVTACQACRLRKTKCDNVRPICGFCSRNGGHCVYYAPGATGDYSTYDPASLAILDRINHVVSLLENRPLGHVGNDTQATSIPEAAQGSPAKPQENQCSPDASTACPTSKQFNVKTADVPSLLDIPDFLSSLNSCESVLRWPIFAGRAPEIYSFVLDAEKDSDPGQHERPHEKHRSLGRGVQEDDFIPLSKRFLAYVHVKNPILDVSDFMSKIKHAAENGPSWDGSSCLVLITCALACLSVPFQADSGLHGTPESTRSTSSAFVDLDTAASYYLAAKKRLGLLQPSLLHIQCLFLFGVYEMYSLQPLQAWFHFNNACVELRNLLWIRGQRRAMEPQMSQQERRLEQRLYWSCVKTEFELRSEIPLPPSGITHCDYPDLFPSPPTEFISPSNGHPTLDSLEEEIIPEEEKSWFYYLAEISHRRMMNRAMETLGRGGEREWICKISEKMEQCRVISDQIDLWYAHLPPQLNTLNDTAFTSELSQYVRNRAISCREWIHRPFLYYAIHQPLDDPNMGRVLPLARKCLEYTIEHLSYTVGHHRHHGTWYIARVGMTRALMLLAAAKSQRVPLPNGWKEALDSARWNINRWSAEAPDLRWSAAILGVICADVEGE